MCLCCLAQLLFWKLARESKSLTRLSPPSSFLLRGDLPLPPSAWSFPSYLISNLRDVTPLVPAIDGIYSFSLLANNRSGLLLTWPIRSREMGKSRAIETYLKLPPHPKVSLTGFYSAIVIQVSISVTFSKFQFEKLNTDSSKFWVISPPLWIMPSLEFR